MKSFSLYFCLLCLSFSITTGQYYPGGINYQAVARDHSGNELKNKNIDVRVSVISGTATGEVEYLETHSATTDGFGLFNFVIGQGHVLGGKKSSLSEVTWGSAPHFLKVEVDFTGNGIFLDMNPLPLQAVPYALHAGTAANAMVNQDYQQLSFNPGNGILSLENGGSVDLSSLVLDENFQQLAFNPTTNFLSLDNSSPVDLSPLIQNLSFQNNILSLSKSNSVSIENLMQDLRRENHKLKITNNPQANEIDLSVYLDNTDSQTLFITADSLGITGGNRIKLDWDDTNEIQGLRIRNDSLIIVKDPAATPVDLSKYINTDNQQLSFNPNENILTLEESEDVNLSKYDKQLSLNDNTLILQNGGEGQNSGEVDLSKYQQKLSLNGYDLSIDNGNLVNIRPEVVAFRATRNGGNPLGSGESTELKYNVTTLNTNNVFDKSTGRFTVPPNGQGLYRFEISYHYETIGHSLSITVNGDIREIIFDFPEYPKSGFLTYSYLTQLIPGDIVSIYLKNTRTVGINCQPGIFSGYRIH